MALYLLSFKTIGRNHGRSAVGAAAYRSGENLYDNRNCKKHYYAWRKDVLHKEILLPRKSPPRYVDREKLWNEVEFAEQRKDARVAKEILVALPRELLLETSIKLIRDFVSQCVVCLGICVDFAIHSGDSKEMYREKYDDREQLFPHNPHCHILMTDRPVDENGFCSAKNPEWNKVSLLINWRKQWAEIQNEMFIKKGLEARVWHESLKERGIGKASTKHLGPKFAGMERRGLKTRIGDYNRSMEVERKRREHQKNIEQELNQNLEIER